MNIHAALYGATSHLNLYVRPPVILSAVSPPRARARFRAERQKFGPGLHNHGHRSRPRKRKHCEKSCRRGVYRVRERERKREEEILRPRGKE